MVLYFGMISKQTDLTIYLASIEVSLFFNALKLEIDLFSILVFLCLLSLGCGCPSEVRSFGCCLAGREVDQNPVPILLAVFARLLPVSVLHNLLLS